MDNIDLKTYLPECYNGIVEAITEQDSLSLLINTLKQRYKIALDDQFVQLASLKAVLYYENMFGIVADPTVESLEVRRLRILTRMKILTPPYTYYYLRNTLDGFFGAGNYNLTIDNNNYIIKLDSAIDDSLWYHEIAVSITAVKPCNMIFINEPNVFNGLNINETIKATSGVWNYKLNGTWQLGVLPFYSYTEDYRGTVKMPGVHSLEQELFDFTLTEYKQKFYKAKINNTTEIIIPEENKSIEADNTLELHYVVTSSVTDIITNIKLLDSNNKVLENSNVYVPVEGTLDIKHILKLKEQV